MCLSYKLVICQRCLPIFKFKPRTGIQDIMGRGWFSRWIDRLQGQTECYDQASLWDLKSKIQARIGCTNNIGSKSRSSFYLSVVWRDYWSTWFYSHAHTQVIGSSHFQLRKLKTAVECVCICVTVVCLCFSVPWFLLTPGYFCFVF